MIVKKWRSIAIAAMMAITLYGETQIVYAQPKAVALPGQEVLEGHDYVLYLANCGTNDASRVPDGYVMGAYQSNVDQQYQEDSTGTSWGYVVEEPYIVYGTTTYDASSITASKRYTGDKITYKKGKSGIYYKFQVPEGSYEVTTGFYNNWDARPVDIMLEGNTVQTSLTLTKNKTIEKQYRITVNDGTLDVFVHNPKRVNAAGDPLLSYIIVKVPLTKKLKLQQAMQTFELLDEKREDYSVQSLEKYDEAYTYVKRAMESQTIEDFEDAHIESLISKLKKKHESLLPREEAVSYTSITGTNGDIWRDNNGSEIQAHGGAVQKFTYNGTTKWYWYGEDKTDDKRTVDGGVRVYSSEDLYNWTDEGVALRNLTDLYDFEEDYFKELYGDCTQEEKEYILDCINDSKSVIERPKVIYNKKNDNYIMWFHADGPVVEGGSNYAVARAGVAVSSSPNGPFKFIDRYNLNYVNGKYDSHKGMARDMNLFVDDDETAYIIYASEQNATLFISKLNEDYTWLSADPENAVEGEDFLRIPCYAGVSREAPAMFKYQNHYYLITSGCTGWVSNPARYAMADSVLGTWTDKGDPCINDKSVCSFTNNTTFNTQPTAVIPYDAEQGKFIYMGDRWNKDTNGDYKEPKYVWLPIEFNSEGEIIIRPYADWTLDTFDQIKALKVHTELPNCIEKNGKLLDKLDVSIGNERQEVAVTWTVTEGDLNVLGSFVTLTGELEEIENRTVIWKTLVTSKNLVYMIDSGIVNELPDSKDWKYYNAIQKEADLLINSVPDQKADGVWGYSGAVQSKTYAVENGPHATGWYGENKENSTFSYELTLDAGSYQIATAHTEWWSNARGTKVEISYESEGSKKTVLAGTASWESNNKGIKKVLNAKIDIPQDETKIKVSFTATGSQAGVVSYIMVDCLTPPVQEETKMTGIKVDTLPNKLVYQIGEELDTTGMVVTASFSDAQKIELSEEEYEVGQLDSSEEGKKEITVTAVSKEGNVFKDSFYVKVSEAQYYTTKIKVTKQPVKITYRVNEEFDSTGMIVTAVKKASPSNATPYEEIIEDYEVEYDFNTAGSKVVEIQYTDTNLDGEMEEFTASVKVTVKETPSEEEEYYTTKIFVTKHPTKMKYFVGEEFDPEGMVVKEYKKASPSNAESQEEIQEYLLKVPSFKTAGRKTIRVVYEAVGKDGQEKEFVDTFSVQVKAYKNDDENDSIHNSMQGFWSGTEGNWTFKKADGSLAKNEWGFINGRWYHFDMTGKMQTNWIQDQGRWYFLNSDGSMVEEQWVLYNGNWYYLHKAGAMLANQWFKSNGVWYYLKEDGSMMKDDITPDENQVDKDGKWITK